MLTKKYLQEELAQRINGIGPNVPTNTDVLIGELKSVLMMVDCLPDDDYEKKYNEALERFKAFKEKYYTRDTNLGDVIFDKTGEMQKDFESVFPKLRESEDERVIKALETFINQPEIADKITFEARIEWLAWLEKQKESLHIPETCKENTDSFTDEDERARKAIIKSIEEDSSVYEQEVSKEQMLAWLEKQKEPEKEELVYRLNGLMQEYINEAKDQEEEEHRFKCYKLFWDALEDASYFEKKEQKPIIAVDSDELLKILPKPAEWNEEDRLHYANILEALEYVKGCKYDYDEKEAVKSDIAWLKDFHPQKLDASKLENFDPVEILNRIKKEWPMAWDKVVGKQEWSEEDEKNWRLVLNEIKDCELRCWFYSVWERLTYHKPHWKPSEEQMEALERASTNKYLSAKQFDILVSLYEQLKKL